MEGCSSRDSNGQDRPKPKKSTSPDVRSHYADYISGRRNLANSERERERWILPLLPKVRGLTYMASSLALSSKADPAAKRINHQRGPGQKDQPSRKRTNERSARICAGHFSFTRKRVNKRTNRPGASPTAYRCFGMDKGISIVFHLTVTFPL